MMEEELKQKKEVERQMKRTPTKMTPNKKRKVKGLSSTPKRDRSKTSTVKRSDLQFPELDDHYDIQTEIARGTYGIVYKARAKGFGHDTFFACKRMFSTVSCGLIVMESEIAKRLNKFHISPQIYDLVQKSGHYSLIFEYVHHDYFVEYINDLSLEDIKYYMYQLLKSISVLEKQGIMHRDIKPGNFLFDPKTRRGYLTDFGLAQVIGDGSRRAKNPDFEDLMELQNSLKVHHRNGTRGYLSPECLFKRPSQNTAVDVWAAGVVLLQLFTKRHQIFFVRDLESQVESFLLQNLIPLISLFGSHEVCKFAYKCGWALKVPDKFPVRPLSWRTIVPAQIPDEGVQLLDSLLKMQDSLRIKPAQALRHKFFDEVRDSVEKMLAQQAREKELLETDIQE